VQYSHNFLHVPNKNYACIAKDILHDKIGIFYQKESQIIEKD